MVHPKLHNINPHSIPKPYGTDVRSSNLTLCCHISLPYIIFCSLMQTTKEVNPHLHIASYVKCGMSSSSSSSSAVTCWMLVHAYATWHGKVKWSGPHQWRWEDNEFKFHSVTCYTSSTVSRIHVNTTKLCNFRLHVDIFRFSFHSFELDR